MEGNRWVKLWESITEWEWYKEANTARLFFHLILKAQYKDTRWQGYDIPRGCVVTSFKRLEEELGLSTQNLRTAIKHLIKSENIENLTYWQGYDIPRGCVVTSFKRLEEELGLSTQNLRTAIKHLIKSENIENLTYEITNIKKANFTIYKVNNYDSFQGGNEQDNKQLTNSQQTPNKQLTTYKKDKKLRNKEIKNIKGFALSDVRFELPLSDGNSYFVVQESLDDWTASDLSFLFRMEILTSWSKNLWTIGLVCFLQSTS